MADKKKQNDYSAYQEYVNKRNNITPEQYMEYAVNRQGIGQRMAEKRVNNLNNILSNDYLANLGNGQYKTPLQTYQTKRMARDAWLAYDSAAEYLRAVYGRDAASGLNSYARYIKQLNDAAKSEASFYGQFAGQQDYNEQYAYPQTVKGKTDAEIEAMMDIKPKTMNMLNKAAAFGKGNGSSTDDAYLTWLNDYFNNKTVTGIDRQIADNQSRAQANRDAQNEVNSRVYTAQTTPETNAAKVAVDYWSNLKPTDNMIRADRADQVKYNTQQRLYDVYVKAMTGAAMTDDEQRMFDAYVANSPAWQEKQTQLDGNISSQEAQQKRMEDSKYLRQVYNEQLDTAYADYVGILRDNNSPLIAALNKAGAELEAANAALDNFDTRHDEYMAGLPEVENTADMSKVWADIDYADSNQAEYNELVSDRDQKKKAFDAAVAAIENAYSGYIDNAMTGAERSAVDVLDASNILGELQNQQLSLVDDQYAAAMPSVPQAVGQTRVDTFEQERLANLERALRNEDYAKLLAAKEWEENLYSDRNALNAEALDLEYEEVLLKVKREEVAAGSKYNELSKAPDFKTLSTYDSSIEDDLYNYLNTKGTSQETGKKLMLGMENYGYDADEIRDSVYSDYGYTFLLPEEVQAYNYIYKKEGREKAQEFLDSFQNIRNLRARSKESEEWKKYAEEAGAWSSVVSWGTKFASGMMYPVQIADAVFNPDHSQFSSLYSANYATQAIRGVRGEVWDKKAKEWFGGKDDEYPKFMGENLGSVAYNLFMGLGDMTLAHGAGKMAATLGNINFAKGVTEFVVGSQVGSDVLLQNLHNGVPKDRAIAMAVAASVIESLTERFSIDAIWKDPDNAAKFIAKNIATEASEESVSTFANTIVDLIVNANHAELSKAIAEDGYEKAMNAYLQSVGLDAIMGGLTGAIMSGAKVAGSAALNTAHNASNTIKTGKQINTNQTYKQLHDIAVAMPEGSKARKIAQGKEKLNNRKAGQLYNALMEELDAKSQAGVRKSMVTDIKGRLQELGAQGDTSQVAEAIQKAWMGEKLSARESDLIAQSKLAMQVQHELLDLEEGWADKARETASKQRRETLTQMLDVEHLASKGYVPAQDDAAAKAIAENASTTYANADQEKGLNTTAYTKEGTTVEIKRIEEQDGKAVYLVEKDGQDVTYAINDLELDSINTENLVQPLKRGKMSVQAANTMMQFYATSGLSAPLYAKGFMVAYNAGVQRIGMAYVNANSYSKALSPEARKAAFDAGMADTKDEAPKVTKRKGRVTVDKSIDKANLTNNQKASIWAMEKIAKALHIDIEFFASKADATGSYAAYENGSFRDGVMRLDINAGRDNVKDKTEFAILRTASHELTHYIAEASPKLYLELQAFVVDHLLEKGESLQALMDRKKARESRAMSDEAALAEVIADACEMMLKDSTAIETLARENATLFEKIADWLREFFDKIREAFAGVEAVHAEARALMEADADGVMRYIEGLQALWDKALVDAARNVQGAQKAQEGAKGSHDIVRYAVRDGLITTESTEAERYEFLKNIKLKVAQVNNDRIADVNLEDYNTRKKSSVEKGIKKLAATLGITNVDLENSWIDFPFSFTNKNLGISIHHQLDYGGTYQDYVKAMSCFDEIVENAVPIETHRDKKAGTSKADPDLKQVYVMMSAFREGKTVTPVQIEIKEYAYRGGKLYLYVALTKTTSEVVENGPTGETGGVRSLFSEDYTISLRQLIQNVNSNDYKFFKYIPDGFLNDEQLAAKERALREQDAEYAEYGTKQQARDADTISGREILANTSPEDYRQSAAHGFLVDYQKAYQELVKLNDKLDKYQKAASAGNLDRDEQIKADNRVKLVRDQVLRQENKLHKMESKPEFTKVIAQERETFYNAVNSMTTDELNAKIKQLEAKYKAIETASAKELEDLELALEMNLGKKAAKELRIVNERNEKLKTENKTLRNEVNLTGKKIDFAVAEKELAMEMNLGHKREIMRQMYESRLATLKSKNAQKLAAANQRGRERLEKYRERVKDTQSRADLRDRIKHDVKALNRLLLNETDVKHVPEELKGAVAQFLTVFTEDSSVFDQKKLDDLRYAYGKISDRNAANEDLPDVSAQYDWDIANMMDELREILPGKRLSELTQEETRKIRDIVQHFKFIVKESSRLFFFDKSRDIASAGQRFIEDTDQQKKYNGPDGAVANMLRGGMITPSYFFKKLGGVAKELFDDLKQGESTYGLRVAQARKFFDDVAEKYHYDAWRNVKDDVLTLNTQQGHEVVLTREQALGLYATWNRENSDNGQNAKHLSEGGFVYEEAMKKDKNGKITVDTTRPHKMTEQDMQAVAKWLTDEQRAYADAMVEYMSKDMAKLGNEVSMKLFGIEKYGEEKYYPYQTSKNYRYTALGAAAATNDQRLKHSSFTHRVTQFANNPIIAADFTTVWANHVNHMLLYSSMCVPLENFNRVYNYKYTDEDGNHSVKQSLINAYGSSAQKYIEQLMHDLNGGVAVQSDGVMDQLISKFKKNAVYASASVVVQQPSAMVRAMALVNPKYFAGGVMKDGSWDELTRYSGVAVIKEMGGFDTSTGFGAQDWITGERRKTKLETFGKKADDIASFLPERADRLAWVAIWKAVKAEVADNTSLEGEELLQAAAKRFDEVIGYTQVYDSTLSKSQMMRNKHLNAVTAFMAEPTVTYNLLVDAFFNRGKADSVNPARAVAAFAATAIVNAMLKSLVTAARDDEEKNYLEKYAGEFVENVTSDLNPLNLIPYARDIVSIMQGYDVERADMSLISDLYKGVKRGIESAKDGDWYTMAKEFAGPISGLVGLPVKNVWRDIEAVFNAIHSIGTPMTPGGMKYSILEALPFYGSTPTDYYGRRLDAMLEGDSSELESLTIHLETGLGKSEKTIKTQTKTQLGKRYKAGKIGDAEATDILMDYFEMDADEAYWQLKEWREKEAHKDEDDYSFSRTDDLKEALLSGKMAQIEAAKTELAGVGGYTGKEVVSKAKSAIKSLYVDGQITIDKAMKLLQEQAGEMTKDDLYWTEQEWAYEKANPDGEWNKFMGAHAAIESGKGAKQAAKELLTHGVEKGDAARAIATRWKDTYVSLYKTDRKAALDLHSRILDMYVALGYSRSYQIKYIKDHWFE